MLALGVAGDTVEEHTLDGEEESVSVSVDESKFEWGAGGGRPTDSSFIGCVGKGSVNGVTAAVDVIHYPLYPYFLPTL